MTVLTQAKSFTGSKGMFFFIAAVRVKLKSFFGETQDNAVTRARLIVKQIQEQILSADDLKK